MSILTQTDLESAVTQATVLQLLDDDRDGTVDAGALAEVLDEGEGEVFGYATPIYSVATLTASPTKPLRRLLISCTVQAMYLRKPEFLNEKGETPYEARYKRAVEQLKEVRAGKFRLDLDDAPEQPANVRGSGVRTGTYGNTSVGEGFVKDGTGNGGFLAMYAFAFSMDPSVLDAKASLLEKTLTSQTQIALQRAGDAVRMSIVSGKYFQNHSGKTAGSFSLVRSGEMGMAVRSRAKVAFFLDQGTKPHVIRPKAAKGFVGPLYESQTRGRRAQPRQVLAFQIGGRTIFRAKVNHPGTKARHFVEAEEQRLRFELLPQLGDEAARRAIADAGLS